MEDTLRISRVEIRSCEADDERVVEAQEILATAQENHIEISAFILQILLHNQLTK